MIGVFMIFFDKDCGTAKVPGVLRPLTAAPRIAGMVAFEAIDYSPGIVARLREAGQDWRDMEPYEKMAARDWLGALGQ